jgi:TetR/AcrR family transcriptional regulator, transcriptional repressor for nem operon
MLTESSPVRDRLIGATIDLIRQKGFESTRVEDICTAAKVSKGAFFHHFASKEAVAIAAAGAWGHGANAMFDARLAHHTDARAFVLAYLDLRIALLTGEAYDYMCYAGTLVEEVWQTHPQVHLAAAGAVIGHIDWLAPKIAPLTGAIRGAELSALIQAGVQGALILAKADGNPERARTCLGDLKRFITSELERT